MRASFSMLEEVHAPCRITSVNIGFVGSCLTHTADGCQRLSLFKVRGWARCRKRARGPAALQWKPVVLLLSSPKSNALPRMEVQIARKEHKPRETSTLMQVADVSLQCSLVHLTKNSLADACCGCSKSGSYGRRNLTENTREFSKK